MRQKQLPAVHTHVFRIYTSLCAHTFIYPYPHSPTNIEKQNYIQSCVCTRVHACRIYNFACKWRLVTRTSTWSAQRFAPTKKNWRRQHRATLRWCAETCVQEFWHFCGFECAFLWADLLRWFTHANVNMDRYVFNVCICHGLFLCLRVGCGRECTYCGVVRSAVTFTSPGVLITENRRIQCRSVCIDYAISLRLDVYAFNFT